MTTLTDRYVHATVRSVPEARRDEIARELRASIHDMVGDRLENGEDHVTAERAVLTELGNPDRLAIQYTDRPNHLIGPRYFVIYQRLVLRLLLWIPVPVGIVVGAIELVDSGSSAAIGEGISTAITVALHVAFWTTLSFAILERTGGETGLPEWTVDHLPDLPAERDVSVPDSIVTLVLLAGLAVVLVGQHFRSWVEDGNGDNVPVFDAGAWQPWLLLVLGSLAVDAVVQVMLMRTGRWTMPLAATYVVSGLLFVVPAVYLSLQEQLFNPEFLSAVGLEGDPLRYTYLAIAFGSIIGTGFEVVPAIAKAWRGGRIPSAADETPQAVR